MRTTLVAVAAALCLLVTGCVAIPTSGSVKAGATIQDNVDVPLSFLPSAPRAGESQTEIVQDFVLAATNPQSDYATARQFLAKSVRQKWNPNAAVTITTGPVTTALAESTLRYQVTASARVDADGRYIEDSSPVVQTFAFGFVKEGKEWRISSLDDGVILSESSFNVIFASHPLYFFDPSYQYLVPDTRWFPTTSLVATRIAKALAAGPASWLQGAVVTAFPPGTTLGDVVVIDSATATVDLSDQARDATVQQTNRMRQQLSASLANVQTVTSVAMTIGGVPVAVSDTAAVQGSVQQTVNAVPLVGTKTSFGFADGAKVTAIPNLSDAVVALSPTGATYSAGALAVTVRSATGVSLVRSGSAQPVQIDSRANLVDPSIDGSGFVWTAQSTNISSISAIDFSGRAHPVNVTALPVGARVVSLEVSRDSTRLLLSLTTSAGPVLLVAGIIRQNGLPVQLGTPMELPVTPGTPVDATWVDSGTVAALSGTGTTVAVTGFALGGASTSLGSVPDATSIVGGNGGFDGIRVLGDNSTVYKPRSTTWQSTGISASYLATQEPG